MDQDTGAEGFVSLLSEFDFLVLQPNGGKGKGRGKGRRPGFTSRRGKGAGARYMQSIQTIQGFYVEHAKRERKVASKVFKEKISSKVKERASNGIRISSGMLQPPKSPRRRA